MRLHLWEVGSIVWGWGVAGGGGEPISQHVGHDYEVVAGVQALSRPYQPVVVSMLARVPCRVDNGVAFVTVELAPHSAVQGKDGAMGCRCISSTYTSLVAVVLCLQWSPSRLCMAVGKKLQL